MLSTLRAAWQAMTRPVEPRWKNLNRRYHAELAAAFDAAQARDDLWQLADFADADASLRADIRRDLRSRARYEFANNTIVNRVVKVWADDVVGERGPVLDMDSGNDELDKLIEADWEEWWADRNLRAKLKTSVLSEAIDGESVDLKFLNHTWHNDQTLMALDILGFESDRLASPSPLAEFTSTYVDGVHLDNYRQPTGYDLLKAHPGHEYLDICGKEFEAEYFPAARVMHAFRKTRPEQHRGVTHLLPVLPLSGLHRKYFEATTHKESLKAAFWFVLKTASGGGLGEDDDGLFARVKLPNKSGLGLMLPEGMDITQFKQDAPAGELDTYNQCMYMVTSGCFSMPLGRAMGFYKISGYAGVRAEMIPYARHIEAARQEVWIPLWLKPLQRDWLREWRLRNHSTIEALTQGEPLRYRSHFRWGTSELVVDPSREAEARRKRLATLHTTLEEECEVNNIEDRVQMLADQLGMTPEEVQRHIYFALWNQPVHGEQGHPEQLSRPEDDD